MHMVQGILLALLHRERTGRGAEGKRVAVQLNACDADAGSGNDDDGDSEVNWAAMPLSGVSTQDGALVLVGAFKSNPLRDICDVLGIDDLSIDPRYCNLGQQFAAQGGTAASLAEGFRRKTRDLWLALLEEKDLLCAPVSICAKRWTMRRRITTR